MKRGGKGKKGEGGVFFTEKLSYAKFVSNLRISGEMFAGLKGSGLKQRQRQSGLMLMPKRWSLGISLSHSCIITHTRVTSMKSCK